MSVKSRLEAAKIEIRQPSRTECSSNVSHSDKNVTGWKPSEKTDSRALLKADSGNSVLNREHRSEEEKLRKIATRGVKWELPMLIQARSRGCSQRSRAAPR
jgi:hypothetical protein